MGILADEVGLLEEIGETVRLCVGGGIGIGRGVEAVAPFEDGERETQRRHRRVGLSDGLEEPGSEIDRACRRAPSTGGIRARSGAGRKVERLRPGLNEGEPQAFEALEPSGLGGADGELEGPEGAGTILGGKLGGARPAEAVSSLGLGEASGGGDHLGEPDRIPAGGRPGRQAGPAPKRILAWRDGQGCPAGGKAVTSHR
jgi:hypothetical protein